MSTQISILILSSAETPQVVVKSGGEPLRMLLMSAAQGGWMSLRIFLGWATGKSTRALVEGAPSFFDLGCRSDVMQHEEGRPEIECTGEGVGAGRYRERVSGVRRGGQKPSARICYAPRMSGPQAIRENRSSETRNRLSTDGRKSETNPVTSPEMSEETNVFVIRKCSREENRARGVGSCWRGREPARFDFVLGSLPR